jgi:hypothetical protein
MNTTEIVKYSDPYKALGISREERTAFSISELVASEVHSLQQSLERHDLMLKQLALIRQSLSTQLSDVQKKFNVVESLHSQAKTALLTLAPDKVQPVAESQPQEEVEVNFNTLCEGATAVLRAFGKVEDPTQLALTIGDLVIKGETTRGSITSFIYQLNKRFRLLEVAAKPKGAQVHHSVQFWRLTIFGLQTLAAFNQFNRQYGK